MLGRRDIAALLRCGVLGASTCARPRYTEPPNTQLSCFILRFQSLSSGKQKDRTKALSFCLAGEHVLEYNLYPTFGSERQRITRTAGRVLAGRLVGVVAQPGQHLCRVAVRWKNRIKHFDDFIVTGHQCHSF